MIASICAYYLSSFTRDFETFLAVTLSFILLGICAASYGFMWGAMFGTGLGGEISTPIDLYQMLISGVYGNAFTVPLYLKYFSVFFLFNEVISYQYWTNVDNIGEFEEHLIKLRSYFDSFVSSPECVPNLPCVKNGVEVLEKYAYGQVGETVLLNYSCALGLIVAFNLIGYFSLKRMVSKEGFY